MTFGLGHVYGSIQHSFRAQGDGFATSGGSTPILRHKTNATPATFILLTSLHVALKSSSSEGYLMKSKQNKYYKNTQMTNYAFTYMQIVIKMPWCFEVFII